MVNIPEAGGTDEEQAAGNNHPPSESQVSDLSSTTTDASCTPRTSGQDLRRTSPQNLRASQFFLELTPIVIKCAKGKCAIGVCVCVCVCVCEK
jgi:hypothetical protein